MSYVSRFGVLMYNFIKINANIYCQILGELGMFYLIMKALSRVILMLTGGVKACGMERLPREGPLIIVSNHQSLLDPVVLLACIPRKITFMAASYLFKIPVVAQVLRLAGAVPVHSEKGDVRSFRKALGILEQGGVIALFPEGGVSPDGNLRPFMPGWAYLATKSGAQVLPVVVRGTRRVLPVGSFLLRPGKIRINVGQPLGFPRKGKIRREYLEYLNRELEQEMLKLFNAGF
ncbi:MAG: 1-acyl-sn-glycerol-3-phosphate acyltransferase [Tepidanaerobacteraceae bacterium]|nr:1-acyl-sn-glycerol-3-phosphate acyltransferase [Tepidanaerobacteraceae bacterium]